MATSVASGVYVFKSEFARGFDMKFSKDAFVVVLSIENKIRASVIEQMVGRANRAQGT